jgi:hypothetical protein
MDLKMYIINIVIARANKKSKRTKNLSSAKHLTPTIIDFSFGALTVEMKEGFYEVWEGMFLYRGEILKQVQDDKANY